MAREISEPTEKDIAAVRPLNSCKIKWLKMLVMPIPDDCMVHVVSHFQLLTNHYFTISLFSYSQLAIRN